MARGRARGLSHAQLRGLSSPPPSGAPRPTDPDRPIVHMVVPRNTRATPARPPFVGRMAPHDLAAQAPVPGACGAIFAAQATQVQGLQESGAQGAAVQEAQVIEMTALSDTDGRAGGDLSPKKISKSAKPREPRPWLPHGNMGFPKPPCALRLGVAGPRPAGPRPAAPGRRNPRTKSKAAMEHGRHR